MSKPSNKEQVLAVTSKFVELAKSTGKSQAVEAIIPYLNRYRLGLFRLVVVGEIKKGKSSFINALLGEPDLLPTMSDVATSTVYKVMYGEEKQFTVFFLPPNPEKPQEKPKPLLVTLDNLAEYGTEDGNPGNRKGVDFIGVQIPHPLLKSGLVIIDTPGLGGLFREHREITWRYLPNADAVFFVMDSVEAVASSDEMRFLSEIRKFTPLIFFVQTKTDLVDTARWQAWRTRNLEIISSELKIPQGKVLYFPVSAKLKTVADEDTSSEYLERSGFAVLLSFVNGTLLPLKDERLASPLLVTVGNESMNIRRSLTDGFAIVTNENKKALDKLERAFSEVKIQQEQWEAGEYQDILREFRTTADDAKRAAFNELQEKLDPSPSNPFIRDTINRIREQQNSAKKIVNIVNNIKADCIEQCVGVASHVHDGYNSKMRQLIEQTAQRLHSTSPLSLELFKPSLCVSCPRADLNIRFSKYEEAKNAVYGSMGGSMVVGPVIGAACLLFPLTAPVVVVLTITSLAGQLFGAYHASISFAERQREEALAKLERILTECVKTVNIQARKQFEDSTIRTARAVEDMFRKSVVEMRNEFKNKVDELGASRKRTHQENAVKAEQLKGYITQSNLVMSALETLLPNKAKSKN